MTLALGHLERQRGYTDKAWEHYYLAFQLFDKSQNAGGRGAASLALGHIERQRGRLDKAADYYQRARVDYRAARDAYGEADATRGLADMLAGRSRFDEAEQFYSEALQLYAQSRDRFGMVDTLVGKGRLAVQQRHLDDAASLFGEAIGMSQPLEYDLGVADGTLGLAEVSLRRGRLDQALSHGINAEETYEAAGHGPGTAEANWILGEVHLRRGQLAQSVKVFDRSVRAFRAQRSQIALAQSLLGTAEAHLRHNEPRRAEVFFGEAESVAASAEQPGLEAIARTGLARIARQSGHLDEAIRLLDEATRQSEGLNRLSDAAHALIEQAQATLNKGELSRAQELAERAQHLAEQAIEATGERGPVAESLVALSAIAAVTGDFASARQHAAEAVGRAAVEGDTWPVIQAALASAEVELLSGNLSAAVSGFNAALSHAKDAEARLQESLANIGLARVLSRRGLDDEAVILLQEHMPQLRAANDVVALAQTLTATGHAQHALRNIDAAHQSFEMARALATEHRLALQEIAALHGIGRSLADVPEMEAASEQYSQAIERVEHISGAIQNAERRAGFVGTYVELYCEAIRLAALDRNGERGAALARWFAGSAYREGVDRAIQRLREYEQQIPIRGADLTKEQIERNKEVVRLVQEARKVLSEG